MGVPSGEGDVRVIDEVIFVFFTYNQAEYLRASLGSAINQTCYPAKLLIFDDASTDDSDSIIREIITGADPSLHIEYERNHDNIGLVSQFNKLVGKFQSKLIVVQAGDDESYPVRIEVTHAAWVSHGKPSLLLANHDDIDELGKIIRPFAAKKIKLKPYSLKRIVSRRAMVYGCCAAISSDLINYFGPMAANVVNEDRVNAFRAFFRKGIVYINMPLLRYRSTIGVSAFKLQNRTECHNKILIEAERELIDIECHYDDLKKINHLKKLKLLDRRYQSVLWKSGIKKQLSLRDLISAVFKGAQPSVVWKTYKHLQKY